MTPIGDQVDSWFSWTPRIAQESSRQRILQAHQVRREWHVEIINRTERGYYCGSGRASEHDTGRYGPGSAHCISNTSRPESNLSVLRAGRPRSEKRVGLLAPTSSGIDPAQSGDLSGVRQGVQALIQSSSGVVRTHPP